MGSGPRWATWLLVAGAVFLVGGCSGAAGRPGKPRIVATFSVLGDFIRNVAGDSAEVITLVGADGDAHTFEPTPGDGIALAEADVILENGVGFETWLDKLHASSQSKARRVVVTRGLRLRASQDHEKGEAHAHEDEHDPHVWHDVKNAIHMVGIIRDSLVEADPPNAEKYRANAAAYLDRLQVLDSWVVEKVGTLPRQRRKLVTSHDTFGYFAARYGFEIAGTVLASVSTEAADPSAADFAHLITTIKATGVPAIFAENVHNPKLMERLAREAGVKLAPPLATDALGKPGEESDTYEKMIRHNVTVIVDFLKP
jgi:zinc/manganese transport system substrate-binding protein